MRACIHVWSGKGSVLYAAWGMHDGARYCRMCWYCIGNILGGNGLLKHGPSSSLDQKLGGDNTLLSLIRRGAVVPMFSTDCMLSLNHMLVKVNVRDDFDRTAWPSCAK